MINWLKSTPPLREETHTEHEGSTPSGLKSTPPLREETEPCRF